MVQGLPLIFDIFMRLFTWLLIDAEKFCKKAIISAFFDEFSCDFRILLKILEIPIFRQKLYRGLQTVFLILRYFHEAICLAVYIIFA